jgi:signal transduction histidine kinase
MNEAENKSGFSYSSVVTSKRQRVLTSKSFLGIGQDVGAETLELVVRIPGDTNPKLLKIDWDKSDYVREPQVILFASLKGSLIETVLETGSEVVWSQGYEYVNGIRGKRLEKKAGAKSVIAVPLIFQEAVIGCALLRSQSRQGFDAQAISKVRGFATIAALVAHGERELSAAEQFNSSLIRWRVNMGAVRNSEALQGIADRLLDALSPAAVIIQLDVGFRHYIRIAGDSDEAKMIRENLDEGLTSMMKRLAASTEIVEADLLDVSDDEKEESIRVGKLYVIVSNNKSAVLTRGSSYSLAPTFATLTTDAVLNAIRDGFNSLINEFALALNNEEHVNNSRWFAKVEDIAKRARLSWVVATDLDDNEQYGRPEWQKVVQACLEKRAPRYDQIDMFRIDDPAIGKHTVLSIYLPGAKSRIWCGVKSGDFGAELSTSSPWKVFLERFSQIADSALLRLRLQRLQMEASETRTLATYVVTSQTVFHQIANMVRDVANPISSIKEALALGRLKTDEDVVDLIKLSDQSAARLLDFAFMFMNVNKLDNRRPCSLLKAVNESKDLFELSLRSNQIQLHVNIDQDLSIDVPYNVAFMAIANLLSNAKDAIGKRGGNIWVKAENVGDMIQCSVTNDGPSVDPKIRDRLFQIGATTKQGQNARGWGLYLVRRSLIENRGYIELSNSNSGETRFTIRFPHVR